MNDPIVLFGGLMLLGLIGGFLLARYLRGVAAVLGWLAWLALPFVLLGLAVVFNDPSPNMTPEHARADAMMGVTIVALFVAMPWFGVNLIGGIIGLVVRRRREA